MSAPIVAKVSKRLSNKYICWQTLLQNMYRRPYRDIRIENHRKDILQIRCYTNVIKCDFPMSQHKTSTFTFNTGNIFNCKPILFEFSNYFWRQSLQIHTTTSIFSKNATYASATCWKCGRITNIKTEFFFCECGVIQKTTNSLNYFQLLGLKESFDIDTKVLSEEYIDLQKRLHPDKYSQSSEEEKQYAEEQSTLINKAYSVLSKPLSRAIYLLKLHNKAIEESSVLSEPEFLSEILQINEDIAGVSTPDELKKIEQQNMEIIREYLQAISEAFNKNDIDTAYRKIVRYQYYSNITEKIKELHRSWIS